MSVQYGGTLRTEGAEIIVERQNGLTIISRFGEDASIVPLVRMRYPQLRQLLTRLSEAEKDAAHDRR